MTAQPGTHLLGAHLLGAHVRAAIGRDRAAFPQPPHVPQDDAGHRAEVAAFTAAVRTG